MHIFLTKNKTMRLRLEIAQLLMEIPEAPKTGDSPGLVNPAETNQKAGTLNSPLAMIEFMIGKHSKKSRITKVRVSKYKTFTS
jgi:hypothetical protein